MCCLNDKFYKNNKKWSNVSIWSQFIAEGGQIGKNVMRWKTMPCVFFLGNTKKIWEKKIITLGVFEKLLTLCFLIFDNLLFYPFWKSTQGIVFQQIIDCIFSILCNKWVPKNSVWPNDLCGQNCHVCKTLIYIWLKKISSSLIYDKNRYFLIKHFFKYKFHRLFSYLFGLVC